ncbi:MAG: hypothetical protein MI924_19720 [Chloroflexales bacterium]|nr:hypothetical protein [Chloroflexales bacterium]
MLVGLLELLIVLVSALIPSVRRLEDRLPDHGELETERRNADLTPQPIRS